MVLRTTLIVGYPGETDAQFEELLDFVRQVRFQRLGAFMYSPEPGTRAVDMPDQLPRKVRQERFDALMTLQQQIATEIQQQAVGQELDVVIDRGAGGTGDPEEVAVGRFWGQAPDIDGVTVVHSAEPLLSGRTVRVKIAAAGPYDLEGRVLPQ